MKVKGHTAKFLSWSVSARGLLPKAGLGLDEKARSTQPKFLEV
jgi:hypothetical protein